MDSALSVFHYIIHARFVKHDRPGFSARQTKKGERKITAIEVKNSILAGLAAAGAFLSSALGGWDAPLALLVALMAADYLTGLLVAAVWQRSDKSATGALDSKAGFQGLVKKGTILLLVWLGVLLDEAVGAAYVRTAVVLFFVGNEGLSLLENLGLMGLPFPAFLRRALEALREKGDGGPTDGTGTSDLSSGVV